VTNLYQLGSTRVFSVQTAAGQPFSLPVFQVLSRLTLYV
jgi:hypothetical protein